MVEIKGNKDIIIGGGEIGSSIKELFRDQYPYIYDVKDGDVSKIFPHKTRIMHICFPFNKDFVKQVKKYQKRFNPEYTVIHSTVPIGTSRKLRAVHSPVVGVHPYLAQSLKTFTKFFGGYDASEVADMFKRQGCSVYVTDKQESTELMKVLCTTNYGLNIEFTKEAKRLCKENDVPFELFTIWNNNYNQGYEKLGYPQYHRYNLVPLMKKIGGHCVIPNYNLLKSKFTEFLKSL